MSNGHFNKRRAKRSLKLDIDNPLTTLHKGTNDKLFLINTMTVSGFSYEKLRKSQKRTSMDSKTSR